MAEPRTPGQPSTAQQDRTDDGAAVPSGRWSRMARMGSLAAGLAGGMLVFSFVVLLGLNLTRRRIPSMVQ